VTLLRLLAAAGFQAATHKGAVATVIRRTEDGKEQRRTFDLDAVLAGKQPDPPLRPGDVVLVRPGEAHEAETHKRLEMDPVLRGLRVQEANVRTKLSNVRQRFGPQHRSARSLEGLLESLRKQIAEREAELRRTAASPKPAAVPGAPAAP
jgi:hypothetical protein